MSLSMIIQNENDMRKFLLSAICLLAIGSISASAQNKQETRYFIDGNEVTNFDGSQLEGLKITSYKIETIQDGKETVSRHLITTEREANGRIIVRPNKEATPDIAVRADVDPVVVINGEKVITKTELEKMPVQNIQSIEVIKNDDNELVKKYSAEGRGLIMVTTKKKD